MQNRITLLMAHLRLGAGLLLLCLASATFGQTGGQTETGGSERPAYFPIDRSEEDWSAFRDPALRTDPWDRLKYIPLRNDPDWYVTLAGELRAFNENYRNYNWGVGPQSDGYYLNRVLSSADFHLGEKTQVFVEFKSGLEFGRNGGPRPVQDEDKLDLQQLFFEVSSRSLRERPFMTFKIGRQELHYGEGTLLDVRDLNVRRSFDGAKLILRPRDWQVDLFAMKPSQSKTGIFDDYPTHDQALWGVYATTTKHVPEFLSQLNVYYLRLDRKSAVFNRGTARDQRHTLGILIHGRKGNFSYFSEADLQVGKFGAGNLLAWKYGQNVSYIFAHVKLQPALTLDGAISSGDNGKKNDDLGTFYPLFPKGLYYGYIDDSGSLNAIVVHPHITFHLSKTVSFAAGAYFFWRESAGDGLYSASGGLVRTAQGVSAKYVGAMQDLAVTWTADRHTTVQLLGAHYDAGSFLKQTVPTGRNIGYVSAKIIYRF